MDRQTPNWVQPVTVWMTVLLTVCLSEYTVMQLLPWFLPSNPSRLLESVLDAVLLTIFLAPLLWWMLVRPLREVIQLRSRFLADLFSQLEVDRRRTAHELHDGVGQSLTLLVSGLRSAHQHLADAETARRCAELQQLAQDALKEVKRLALGLRPSLLDDLGLAPALERLVADVRQHHDIEIALEVSDIMGAHLPDPVATAVFRIVQEALTNIVKYSQARHAFIIVQLRDAQVRVTVEDDGCGIEPSRLLHRPPGHLGLTGMHERATLLGGEFTIDSTPGHGTRIAVSLPTGGTHRGEDPAASGG